MAALSDKPTIFRTTWDNGISHTSLARLKIPLTQTVWKFQLILLIVFCFLGGFYSVSLGTDANWDLKNYHYYGAYAFLNGRIYFDIAPAQIQSFFNPMVDIPYYLSVQAFNTRPRVVAFIMGVPAGIYAFALAQIAWIMARQLLGVGLPALALAGLATLLGMTGAAVRPLIGTTTNDVSCGALVMLALWLDLRAVEAPTRSFREIWLPIALAGLLAGASLGLKLTNVIYVAPLSMLILLLLGFRLAIVAGLAMVLAFVALWLPFALILWREFGSPLFPMYNDIFRSPDYYAIRVADLRFLPRNWMQGIFYPFYWLQPNSGMVAELRMRDARVALGYIAVLGLFSLIAFQTRLRLEALCQQRSTILLVAFCVSAYAIWAKMFGIYRYFVLVESLAGVLVMVALVRLQLGRHWLVAGTFALIVAIVMRTTIHPNWGHVPLGTATINVPPLPVPSGAMLLFASAEPMAYLAPSLPAVVRVVGLANNLVLPGDDHGLMRRIRQAITDHRGPFWAVSGHEDSQAAVEAVLDKYGLRLGTCQVIHTNIDPAGYRFCEVERQRRVPAGG